MHSSLFISYTSRTEVSRSTAQRLESALRNAGHVPFLDTSRRTAGNKWTPELTQALVRSRGGVIVLCEEALQSDWVRREATFLLTRLEGAGLGTSTIPSVIVLLVDGLRVEQLENTTFAPLHIDAYQLVVGDQHGVEVVVQTLEPLKRLLTLDHPEDRIRRRIAEYLRGLSLSMLGQLAQDLDESMEEWFPNDSYHEQLVEHLAHCITRRTLLDLVEGLRGVVPVIPEHSWRIFHEALPFQADERRSAMLRELASGDNPCITGLNALRSRFAELHVHRASGGRTQWICACVNNITDGENQTYQLLEEAWSAFHEQYPDRDRDDLRHWMARKKTPNILIVHGPVSPDALDAVQNDIPNVQVLLVHDELTEAHPLCDHGPVQFLRPALDHDTENQIWTDFLFSQQELRNLLEQEDALDRA